MPGSRLAFFGCCLAYAWLMPAAWLRPSFAIFLRGYKGSPVDSETDLEQRQELQRRVGQSSGS